MDSVVVKPPPDVHVARRRDLVVPADNRRLKRLLSSGEWHRVAPGAFADGRQWRDLTAIDRHRLRVFEAIARLPSPTVVSQRAAAAFWDMDVLGDWPSQIDVTTARAPGGRSGGVFRRHAVGLEGVDRIAFGHHEITTAAQTALDLARTLPFMHAVAVVDQALWADRDGGALTTKEEILALMTATAPRRGDVRARRVIDAAETGAANVRETQTRLVIAALGFPIPRLQERRVLRSGRLVFGDMYFPEHDHWLEVDGRGKYLSPQFGPDRRPADIVIDEKNRENEIRREVRGFSRLEAADADHPGRVYDILVGDGLPPAKPRPRG